MLLLVAGNSVPEELFYYLANGKAFDTCDGLYLDHNLHGTDDREPLPGSFDVTGLLWTLLFLGLLLLLWLGLLLGDAPYLAFKVCQTTGIRFSLIPVTI